MTRLTLSVRLRETELILGKNLPTEAVRLASRELWAWLLGESPAWVASHEADILSARADRRFLRLRARLEAGEPLAYVIGSAPFRGQAFRVSRATLIPRPETEELVELALASPGETLFVDIGTGSGCIGVSLALARGARQVILTDRSRRALSVAEENARRLLAQDADRLTRLQGSLFFRELQREVLRRAPKRLAIVANLPYLPLSDRKTLARGVTAFEPSLALYGGLHGDELVRRLLKQVERFQRAHPMTPISLFLEIDPPQANALLGEAVTVFPDRAPEIVRDGFGRERFLVMR